MQERSSVVLAEDGVKIAVEAFWATPAHDRTVWNFVTVSDQLQWANTRGAPNLTLPLGRVALVRKPPQRAGGGPARHRCIRGIQARSHGSSAEKMRNSLLVGSPTRTVIPPRC